MPLCFREEKGDLALIGGGRRDRVLNYLQWLNRKSNILLSLSLLLLGSHYGKIVKYSSKNHRIWKISKMSHLNFRAKNGQDCDFLTNFQTMCKSSTQLHFKKEKRDFWISIFVSKPLPFSRTIFKSYFFSYCRAVGKSHNFGRAAAAIHSDIRE